MLIFLSGGDAEGGSVCVLVCAVFGDPGAGRQHQPQQPGGSAGVSSGERRHIQPTRRVVLLASSTSTISNESFHHFDCTTSLFFLSPETGLEQRHMAFCSLFSEALALLNGVGVSTGEALAAHVITWLDRKGRGFPILPLLTACSRCLASVRHMTRIMEACITAYFNHGNQSNCFI